MGDTVSGLSTLEPQDFDVVPKLSVFFHVIVVVFGNKDRFENLGCSVDIDEAGAVASTSVSSNTIGSGTRCFSYTQFHLVLLSIPYIDAGTEHLYAPFLA